MTWETFWFIPAEASSFFSHNLVGSNTVSLSTAFVASKETGAEQNTSPLQMESTKYDYITMIMKRVVYIYMYLFRRT